MKSLYGDKLRVCFSDNDSFLNLIETEDLNEDIKEYEHLFDTSDFPKQYVLYSKHNKKVLGKFKEELNGEAISEFVELRPKIYYYTNEGDEKHTAKGITKSSSR